MMRHSEIQKAGEKKTFQWWRKVDCTERWKRATSVQVRTRSESRWCGCAACSASMRCDKPGNPHIITSAVNGGQKSKEYGSLCCLHLLEYLQRSLKHFWIWQAKVNCICIDQSHKGVQALELLYIKATFQSKCSKTQKVMGVEYRPERRRNNRNLPVTVILTCLWPFPDSTVYFSCRVIRTVSKDLGFCSIVTVCSTFSGFQRNFGIFSYFHIQAQCLFVRGYHSTLLQTKGTFKLLSKAN